MTGEADRAIKAGEYVLGLLDSAEEAAFDRQRSSDPALEAEVVRWQERLAPIDRTASPIEPSPGLWPRIEADLKPAADPARSAQATSRATQALADAWRSLWMWRGLAFAGLATAAVLAAGLIGALDRARRQPVMVAVLMTDTNVAAAVVNTFSDGRVELLPLQDIAVPQGRALEIWTLWDRAVGPRSIGLVDRARSTPLRLDNLPLGPDQLFEITIEPAAGSPIGRPTGPIVAKGLTAKAL
jgi:anti-sigma-K factor RskA